MLSITSKTLTFLIAIAAIGSVARAEEIPEHFTPVRPAGMGGAFTAVANDENAIWTNPAGISRARKARSRNTFNVSKFPNLIVGANGASRTFYEGFKGAQDKSVEGILGEQEGLGDKPFYARAAVFPVTLFDLNKNSPMSFGVYSNTTAKAVIQKDSPEEAHVEAISDLGTVIGFGFASDSNRFNVGLQFRPIWRYAYEDSFPSEDLLNKGEMKRKLKEDANRSQGLGADFGLLYTVADFWYPTVGIAILNLPTGCHKEYLNPFTEKRETVCGTAYSGDFSNKDALSVVDPTDIRAGVSITPRLTRKMAMRFALDLHQLPLTIGTQSYGLSGIEPIKLLHAGAELFFGNPLEISPLSLRAGYGQGFATMGASLNLGFVSLDFATFGRDVSSSAKPVEDRRYMASISFDF